MTKNIKSIFFVLTLVMLLVTVGAVCAADDTNSTNTASDSSVSDVTTVSDTTTDTVAHMQTRSNDNKVDTKTIEKEDKNLKSTTKTVEVNNYNELTTAINNAANDEENDEYIINLNEGEYKLGWSDINFNSGSYQPNIIINANQQTLSPNSPDLITRVNSPYGSRITINDAIINHRMAAIGNLTFVNCLLNNSFTTMGNGNLIIDDTTTFGNKFDINGNIIINDTSRIIPYISEYRGNYTIENVTINGNRYNYGNMTIINSNVNAENTNQIWNNRGNTTIINTTIGSVTQDRNANNQAFYAYNSTLNGTFTHQNGILLIGDDVIFGNSFSLSGAGIIIINDSNKIYPYATNFNGNHQLSNISINKQFWNNGNMTLSNCILNNTINNYGNLTICDDCIFGENFGLSGSGEIVINDTNKIYPYINTFSGDNQLSNLIINKSITNKGNLTLKNVTIDNTITNNGILIIDDDCVFTENAVVKDNSEIIINDTTRLSPYLTEYNGDYIIENTTIKGNKNNNGNLTIKNTTINSQIYNYGNLSIDTSIINKTLLNYQNVTISNTTLNSTINNQGTIIISDDTVFGENLIIKDYGQIISNKSIAPYLQTYNGNYTIENATITTAKTNQANLTIINSTVNSQINNNGNLTINQSILNSSINNRGVLIIDDETILGENLIIGGNGTVIYNDFEKILPYLGSINGDYTLENKTINGITTYGNIKLVNCNITGKIANYNNLTIINSSLSNNNMTSSSYTSSGYLLQNLGNATLIGCNIENNTFNTTRLSNMITLYGAIVNNGVLNVENCSFYNNSVGYEIPEYIPGQYYTYGYNIGIGSCIVNLENGNLNINGSVFSSNYAGNTSVIFSKSNITIDNSTFYNNSAVRTNEVLYVTNNQNQGETIVEVNIYRSNFTGNYINRTIHIDTTGEVQAPILLNALALSSWQIMTAHITDCYFENSLYSNFNTTIEKSTFNNNGFTIDRLNKYPYNPPNNQISENIFNNTRITTVKADIFNNTLNNTYFQTRDSTIYNNTIINGSNMNNNKGTIYNNTYQNASISDSLTLNIPNKTYEGETITITGNYTITAPQNYDENILEQNKFQVYINGILNQTLDNLEFNITPTAGNMIVTVQPTISTTKNTTVFKSTTLSYLTITPENYNTYVYEGTILGIGKDTKIIFEGNFENKDEITFDTNDILIDGENATFTNTRFILDAENITIQNMKINNTETTYPIANYQNNNIITNSTITLTNTNEKAAAIYNHASNTEISNNILNVQVPADDVDFSSGTGVAPSQAILLLGGDQNIIQNNTITIKSSSSTGYGTLEAITNSNGASNTLIKENNIIISDGNFNYAIDCLNNVENITIIENNITVNGERYCDGIQVGNNANNILIEYNNITCTCINSTPLDFEGAITYGVIATSMGSGESENITINNNNINITGTANYGIELYKVSNTEIHDNNITVTGPYSLGIGYSYAPNGNAIGNHININGDSTTPINQITEEIKPENTGIRIQNGTQNIYMEANTITTSDVGGQDTTIHSDEESVTAINNRLTSSKGYGDETIIAPETADISDNVIYPKINVEDITTIINTPTTLQATVTTIDGNNINTGTVYFKDISRRIIASADVINGTAQVDHIFKETTNTLMYVVYNSTSSGIAMIETMITLTVKDKFQTTIRIDEVNPTAGETVSITAHITDENDEAITGGKVSFKVNGKTVKDANGKVVYAKVVDGVATAQYTVPENLGGQDINITAVYTGTTKYNKETTTIATTVTAPEAKLTITPIISDVQTGSTVTLKAKVAAGDKAITTGKIVFKVNGKTVKDANGKVIYAKVDANGEVSVDYTIPESFKAGTYNIEAVFTASGYEKLTDNTTMTVVKS